MDKKFTETGLHLSEFFELLVVQGFLSFKQLQISGILAHRVKKSVLKVVSGVNDRFDKVDLTDKIDETAAVV